MKRVVKVCAGAAMATMHTRRTTETRNQPSSLVTKIPHIARFINRTRGNPSRERDGGYPDEEPQRQLHCGRRDTAIILPNSLKVNRHLGPVAQSAMGEVEGSAPAVPGRPALAPNTATNPT